MVREMGFLLQNLVQNLAGQEREHRGTVGDRLEFSKFGTLKVFGFLGDIYPKAALATEGTGALDCES